MPLAHLSRSRDELKGRMSNLRHRQKVWTGVAITGAAVAGVFTLSQLLLGKR